MRILNRSESKHPKFIANTQQIKFPNKAHLLTKPKIII